MRRAGRGPDLDEVRTGRALAALDPVAGDGDVVRRGRPGEVDLTLRHSGRGKARRVGRRGRVGRAGGADRRVHIRLQLGRAQRPVVDAHLVDATGEVLPVERIAADRQRPVEVAICASTGRLATSTPFTTGARVAPSKVAARWDHRAQGQRRARRQRAVNVPARRRRTRFRRAHQVIDVVRTLVDHVPPAAAAVGRPTPRNVIRRRQIERRRIGDGDSRTRTVEGERIPVLARRDPAALPIAPVLLFPDESAALVPMPSLKE